MNSQKTINLESFIRHISVILLLFSVLNVLFLDTQHAFAQTGAPPPPTEPVILPPAGTLLIDPIFPAIAPTNIPALVGNGTLAVIPQNEENAVALINLLLSNGTAATLLVPASGDTDLIAQIQEVEVGNLPATTLPVAFTSPLKVFQITIFDAETGELITIHNPALQFGIALSPGVSPEDVALLYFNASEKKYETIDITGDPIKGIVKAEITETSTLEEITNAEINQYSPFALISTAVSPDLANAENEDTSSQAETIAQVQATPTLSQADTTASAQEIGTQADSGTASRSLFGSATDGNESSQSLFGSPTDNESENDSQSDSEPASSEEASIASAYDSAESQSNSSNNNPLLSGFAVLISSLGAGFGFLRWRFN